MIGQAITSRLLFIIFFLFFSISSFPITTSVGHQKNRNPFTPKAYLIRYWNKHISNTHPKPQFLLSKATPLTAFNLSLLIQLISQHSLSSHIDLFCSSANLFCFSETQQKGPTRKDSNFALYTNVNFSSYGPSRLGGVDSFKNYSGGVNIPHDSFKRYSSGSTNHTESFTSYSEDANVANSSFANYGPRSTGGSGEFRSYELEVNVPNLRFTSYDSDGNRHKLSFNSYTDEANVGSEQFINYGKNGNGIPSEFINYGTESNSVDSTFSGYGGLAKTENDTFKGYGLNGNNPHNNFKGYGLGGNSSTDSFINYRDQANAGDDTFQSYGRNSKSATANFQNYGKSFNVGPDTFQEYGRSAIRPMIGFKGYGLNNTFKDYARNGVTFAQYSKTGASTNFSTVSGSPVNKWVETGKFFREFMLKEGTVMRMPDISDKMPKRSFLPRSILSKLPFSTTRLSELKEIFHAAENMAIESVLVNTLAECERSPSPGETKRCVGSIEDMIDFAVSVLGHNVVVRTTENIQGSKSKVMIGSVRGINGGRVTRSVSCHQSLFPYLLYYCHSVPKVRVYEVDILSVESKVKINHGIAICHLDTSAWSPGHGAFVVLGFGPGQIEVCHWIFENDMTWTIAD
ncbi:BURP domain [Dillenia turbinata]|uniref:BURP domain n=1 Tax=Dillenia turbinata TaxID=194707 RepID=A0AAN8US32_9MAGN